MEKHFVRFYSPGTFFAETTDKEIDSWDVEKAKEMAKDIIERYGAKPYGFQFITRSRKPEELDSSVSATSNMYYLGGRIRTLEEVEREQPDSVLARNMRGNGYDRIIESSNGWKWTQPLMENDVVLEPLT
jgi:hypothetical protein